MINFKWLVNYVVDKADLLDANRPLVRFHTAQGEIVWFATEAAG